jgi:hypothetical protein
MTNKERAEKLQQAISLIRDVEFSYPIGSDERNILYTFVVNNFSTIGLFSGLLHDINTKTQHKELRPISKYADVYTLADFKSMVESHTVTDGDGIGYYAMADGETRIEAIPSIIEEGVIMGQFTHVTWYNK